MNGQNSRVMEKFKAGTACFRKVFKIQLSITSKILPGKIHFFVSWRHCKALFSKTSLKRMKVIKTILNPIK